MNLEVRSAKKKEGRGLSPYYPMKGAGKRIKMGLKKEGPSTACRRAISDPSFTRNHEKKRGGRWGSTEHPRGGARELPLSRARKGGKLRRQGKGIRSIKATTENNKRSQHVVATEKSTKKPQGGDPGEWKKRGLRAESSGTSHFGAPKRKGVEKKAEGEKRDRTPRVLV